jgi:hypothetical protein
VKEHDKGWEKRRAFGKTSMFGNRIGKIHGCYTDAYRIHQICQVAGRIRFPPQARRMIHALFDSALVYVGTSAGDKEHFVPAAERYSSLHARVLEWTEAAMDRGPDQKVMREATKLLKGLFSEALGKAGLHHETGGKPEEDPTAVGNAMAVYESIHAKLKQAGAKHRKISRSDLEEFKAILAKLHGIVKSKRENKVAMEEIDVRLGSRGKATA